MFVGEAPGRLGADASGIPFHGDQTGHNFEELLRFVGLDRSQVFITNAVLCNPRTEDGHNATPKKSEVANCSGYLREQIDLVRPKVIATLGAIALEALEHVEPHGLALSRHVRTAHRWYGRILVPLYHPGARALIHRSSPNQRSDFQFLAETLRRATKARKAVYGTTRTEVVDLVRLILARYDQISYFALHKVLYLVEWNALESTGRRASSAFFLRQKDGPYCTDIHLTRLKRALPELVVSGPASRPILSIGKGRQPAEAQSHLPAEYQAVVKRVLESTIHLSDAELKIKVYLTKPLRAILRAERARLVNLYNTPIFTEGGESVASVITTHAQTAPRLGAEEK